MRHRKHKKEERRGTPFPYQKAKTSDNGNDTFFICNTRPPGQNTNIGYIKTGKWVSNLAVTLQTSFE